MPLSNVFRYAIPNPFHSNASKGKSRCELAHRRPSNADSLVSSILVSPVLVDSTDSNHSSSKANQAPYPPSSVNAASASSDFITQFDMTKKTTSPHLLKQKRSQQLLTEIRGEDIEDEDTSDLEHFRASASCSPVPPSPGIRIPPSPTTPSFINDYMDRGITSSPELMTLHPNTSVLTRSAAAEDGKIAGEENRGRRRKKKGTGKPGAIGSKFGSLFFKKQQEQTQQGLDNTYTEEHIVVMPGNEFEKLNQDHSQILPTPASMPAESPTTMKKKRSIGAFLPKPFRSKSGPAAIPATNPCPLQVVGEGRPPQGNEATEGNQQHQKHESTTTSGMRRRRKGLLPKLPRLDTRPRIFDSGTSEAVAGSQVRNQRDNQAAGVKASKGKKSKGPIKSSLPSSSIAPMAPLDPSVSSLPPLTPVYLPTMPMLRDLSPMSFKVDQFGSSSLAQPGNAETKPDMPRQHSYGSNNSRLAPHAESAGDVSGKGRIYESTTYASATTTMTLLWNWRVLTNNNHLYHDDRWDRVSVVSTISNASNISVLIKGSGVLRPRRSSTSVNEADIKAIRLEKNGTDNTKPVYLTNHTAYKLPPGKSTRDEALICGDDISQSRSSYDTSRKQNKPDNGILFVAAAPTTAEAYTNADHENSTNNDIDKVTRKLGDLLRLSTSMNKDAPVIELRSAGTHNDRSPGNNSDTNKANLDNNEGSYEKINDSNDNIDNDNNATAASNDNIDNANNIINDVEANDDNAIDYNNDNLSITPKRSNTIGSRSISSGSIGGSSTRSTHRINKEDDHCLSQPGLYASHNRIPPLEKLVELQDQEQWRVRQLQNRLRSSLQRTQTQQQLLQQQQEQQGRQGRQRSRSPSSKGQPGQSNQSSPTVSQAHSRSSSLHPHQRVLQKQDSSISLIQPSTNATLLSPKASFSSYVSTISRATPSHPNTNTHSQSQPQPLSRSQSQSQPRAQLHPQAAPPTSPSSISPTSSNIFRIWGRTPSVNSDSTVAPITPASSTYSLPLASPTLLRPENPRPLQPTLSANNALSFEKYFEDTASIKTMNSAPATLSTTTAASDSRPVSPATSLPPSNVLTGPANSGTSSSRMPALHRRHASAPLSNQEPSNGHMLLMLVRGRTQYYKDGARAKAGPQWGDENDIYSPDSIAEEREDESNEREDESVHELDAQEEDEGLTRSGSKVRRQHMYTASPLSTSPLSSSPASTSPLSDETRILKGHRQIPHRPSVSTLQSIKSTSSSSSSLINTARLGSGAAPHLNHIRGAKSRASVSYTAMPTVATASPTLPQSQTSSTTSLNLLSTIHRDSRNNAPNNKS
ncbi:hypothetical protein BX616_006264 [Lobosporangium transversale]|nr:hypothetical protein BX616_006264 [Lobosporangium transversale]